jgi:hypothetical protein
MGKKKTHEEQVKQINVKQLFADKVYKKMRADRYGLTFCCPNDLEKINIKNYTCDWQDLEVIQYDESFTQTIIQDPGVQSCAPPSVLNPITGLCEVSVTATTVGSNTYSQANADPNGTPNPVQYENQWRFGKECPIIFDSIQATNGVGGNPTLIGQSLDPNQSWWITYDATPGGANHNPSIHTGVTEVSLINALAKEPTGGWPNNTTLEFAVPINVATTKTYYVLLSADNHFGITLDGVDLITLSQENVALAMSQQAANVSTSGPISNLPAECFKFYSGYGLGSYGYMRGWLYPVEITAGCHTLILRGRNDIGSGMFAFMVLDNTRTEIINSTSRDDLTEIIASDTITNFYTNINPTTPWSCTPPATLFTGSPYSASCPGCQTQTSTTTLECPQGLTLNTITNLCEGIAQGCDTETLMIYVVNQNGDPMPNYEIIFDGGNYVTDDDGFLMIVVEDASINTTHTFNISCICITTSGGCAIQQIDIVVADPNVETCTYPDLPCQCVAPSFVSEIFKSPNMHVGFIDANFAAGNTVTATSYTLAWRVKGTTTWGPWNEITGLIMDPITGMIYYNFLAFPVGSYEYKIKSICDDEESAWSATNNFIITKRPTTLSGCTDPDADNYNDLATTDDGSCTYTVYGCTDSTASNYYGPVPSNTTLIDDGSCTYACILCTAPGAITTVPGCCDPSQSNYNPNATCDDGSCIPTFYGCIDPSADNYTSNPNVVHDGSCVWLGCTDPSYQWCNNYIGPAGPAPSPTGFIDPITGQVLMGTNIDNGSCNDCYQS